MAKSFQVFVDNPANADAPIAVDVEYKSAGNWLIVGYDGCDPENNVGAVVALYNSSEFNDKVYDMAQE